MKKFLMTFLTAVLLTVSLCIPAFAVDGDCAYLAGLKSGDYSVLSSLACCYDDAGHYYYCLDCGEFAPSEDITGVSFLHSEERCAFCLELEFIGLTILGPLPETSPNVSILSTVTDIVTAAVGWLTAFVFCIVSDPLLLGFVIIVFVGLGIGLIKRVIHL